MTAIDRTAYPRPSTRLTREELDARYALTETDLAFIDVTARGDTGRLRLATLLKTRRDLACFPAPDEPHAGTVAYLAAQLGVAAPQAWPNGVRRTKSRHRCQAAVRAHLCVTPYDDAAKRLVASTVLEAAGTMSDPADLINRTVEALQAAAIDLPAFRTLDRLVHRLRTELHGHLHDRVAVRLTAEHAAVPNALLNRPPDSPTTGFNRLKQAPGPATPKTVRLWTDRLDWLGSLLDPDPPLEGIVHTKLRRFAAEAAALEVGDLLDIAQPGRRCTLLLARLRQARMRCRDGLIEMMLRRPRHPRAGEDFAATLKSELTTLAAEVDAGFPANTEFSLDADGTPHLKQPVTTEQPAGLAAFEQEIRARMPEHHLLDILKHAEHWSRCTRHFGPPSGSDPKLARAVQRHLFTAFGYGCNLGPGQTARHAPEIATAQALRRINAQHINAGKLEAAMVDLIGQHARFPLPRHWGNGCAAIADGTHAKLCENNLLGSRHIGYGGYGGLARHHIADSCIALFTSFIPCGVWEAVHILDGLLKNRSDIQPDTLHADTQGQSEPVFGLCRLLGIKLMPRMRGLGDVVFHRPAKSVRHEHIDALFGGAIDWDLIATHARDMIQVVLSIQAGWVMPSMLLRRLGTSNRRSLLYRAFREFGRIERTLFLLRFISSVEIRRVIRAETTKIEACNDFLDWVSFGGPVIKSGDPMEQEKHLKHASLVANAIMLSNVADLTTVLSSMAADGHPVTPALVACLSPYTRGHILRFGRDALDMDDLPGPLDPQPLPFEQAP
jgi:TnpA family transposase